MAKGVYPLMYYSHNLHFVSSSHDAGQYEDALDYARRLRRNVEGAIDEMPMLAPYGTLDGWFLLAFSEWDELLAQPWPKEKTIFLNAMYRYSAAGWRWRLGQVEGSRGGTGGLGRCQLAIPEDRSC